MQRRRGGGGWRNVPEEAAETEANFSRSDPDLCHFDTYRETLAHNKAREPIQ